MSEFCFEIIDENFAKRAKKAGSGIIVAGSNYGQGSSREHAALVPLYLGIKAVLAKSFARIHAANLINAGILPLVFDNPEDYKTVDEGDRLEIHDIHKALEIGKATLKVIGKNGTEKKITSIIDLTKRQRNILLAGGLLKYTMSI